MKPLFVMAATEKETDESQKDHGKVTDNSHNDYSNLTELMMNILSLVKENSFITTIEIAKELNVKRETVSRNISKLKEMGYIKRIGGDKAGHWEIIDKK